MTSVRWTKGYTQAELDRAQDRFGLVFPPDLIDLLRRKRPIDGHDWTDDAAIRRALDWPLNGLLVSVERGQIWWPEWGKEPSSARARKQILREVVARAPKLIPLIGHRYLPEQPHEAGNPVFSIFYTDAIYYGANLKDYFEREFGDWHRREQPWSREIKYIPFWSDLVERFAQQGRRPT
ncbi:hypothetical protein [Bradyrhizobium sp. NAS96.2]|uniref:hypothetical protein n=1 Tax=Bradyrhizobium sp. NAS96.2 TaxID=1680160 RepID=UPI00093FC089|nr:hypothetical protein [Bradyrhizobium sp. NAS96.2]OKO74792.1 hypothetical protein AC628_22020 [Bradyrhizobium sp. NAS96.2]